MSESIAAPVEGHSPGTDSVGHAIKQLRLARGLSLRRLADQADIRAATLSRWESQKRVPRLPELMQVLSALEATTVQKKAVLQRMGTTQAVQAYRRSSGVPLAQHDRSARADLLWAMRQRKGWTQAQTARAAGVTQSQVARWESGETWPDGQKLHTLCWSLGAAPEETLALTVAGPLSERFAAPLRVPDNDQDKRQASRDVSEWMILLENVLFGHASDPLIDLMMIAIEQRLEGVSGQPAATAVLLPAAYAVHARCHLNGQRMQQAARFAGRGLALIDSLYRSGSLDFARTPYSLWFGNVIVASEVANGSHPAGVRCAVETMKRWLPLLPNRTDGQWSWGLSTLAPLLIKRGCQEEAIALGSQACAKAASPQEVDRLLRCIDQARLLMSLGRNREALSALENYQEEGDFVPRHFILRYARVRDECLHLLAE